MYIIYIIMDIFFSQPGVSCYLPYAGLLWGAEVSLVIFNDLHYKHQNIYLIMEILTFLGGVIHGI